VAYRDGVQRSFVTQVNDAMRQRGISRAELSRRLGCSGARVTHMLKPSANLKLETMVKIVSALGLDAQFTVTDSADTHDVVWF